MAPAVGADAYSSIPSAKKIVYVVLRPMRSDSDAQKILPPMLKRLSRLVNPAAADAVTTGRAAAGSYRRLPC